MVEPLLDDGVKHINFKCLYDEHEISTRRMDHMMSYRMRKDREHGSNNAIP